eukprot:TRINITY_DN10906_c0_g1_i2.p1 TRINITY_DN10906_c0_g1~~TRINITY_DN10906_c0_g1_i2.p1  ORF type:complete len:163 (+),score=24.26 TRINITY_DN10906_c0_g1_i2:58-546(+)
MKVGVLKHQNGYWKNRQNRRDFLDKIAQKRKLSGHEDWYRITARDIEEFQGGSGFLKCFDESTVKAITSVYPEHSWKVWKFHQVPKGFWSDRSNQRHFLLSLAEEKGWKQFEDWHQLKSSEIIKEGGIWVVSLLTPDVSTRRLSPKLALIGIRSLQWFGKSQ